MPDESKRRPIIAVCGAGTCGPDLARTAEEVGREIAGAGATLICGGLSGVMEASAKGARQVGGLTIGVLPGPSKHDANPYIDIPVVTNMGQARNVIIVSTADAVIAVGGAYGTLSEVAIALKIGKPVVSIGSWEVADEIFRATNATEAVKIVMSKLPED